LFDLSSSWVTGRCPEPGFEFLNLGDSAIWAARVFGSAVLPWNTSMAMGTPFGEHSSP
jgi:hypothetical protein